MIFEHWEDDGGSGHTLIEKDNKHKEVMTLGLTKKWEVEADSWIEAMNLYYEHMGWGEYQPMKND